MLLAPDELSARLIAKQIVGSSLVKTAIFGADPNWGRDFSDWASQPLMSQILS